MKELIGTKAGAGVWQRIISEIPPHDVFIEAFWGRGTISRRMRRPAVTIGIDLDPDALSSGEGLATMFHGCGMRWVKDYFRLGAPVARSDGGTRLIPTFGGFAVDRHFVYFDPPYPTTIGRGYYDFEPTEAEHVDLCRLFRSLPCPAALSGYDCDLYDEELAGVRSISYQTVNRAGRAVVERLWTNYPAPEELHDARFIGNGRRERERIRRRVKTWSEGLLRMPPAERQAILQACQEAVDQSDPVASRTVTPRSPSS